AALRGSIVVVNFWFIACPPCRVENPKLNEVVKELGDRVAFVGFADDAEDKLEEYLKKSPFAYQIVADSKSIALTFGVHGYPTHLVIDRAGNIVWEATGGRPETVQTLRTMIYRTLAGN